LRKKKKRSSKEKQVSITKFTRKAPNVKTGVFHVEFQKVTRGDKNTCTRLTWGKTRVGGYKKSPATMFVGSRG